MNGKAKAMTREEALDWLESVAAGGDAYDFCVEWIGPANWHAYQWFGPAGEVEPECKGTIVECVEWLKRYIEERSKSPLSEE